MPSEALPSPFLGILIVALGALAATALLPSTVSASTPPPGPCEDGYVAPTPTAVPVTSIPVTAASTTSDYFVLYVKRYYSADRPILVKLGEDGTTTLADNLESLAADRYRVEKYSVAQPGDLDGDCIDDLTELADLGKYNPISPAKTISRVNGTVAIDSRETFEELSFKGDTGTRGLEHLDGLEFVKFTIRDLGTKNPATYFINTNTTKIHANFDRAVGLPVSRPTYPSKGTIVYYPNVKALDGSLGVYAITLDLWGILGFGALEELYEVLASAMPFLRNNLYYHPFTKTQVDVYQNDKDTYDASRVNVLLDEDIAPDVDFIPLNQAEGYGRLRRMAEGDRPSPFDVAIYETLPNDLPRVAGTITTVPQTPLSHVNLRAIQNSLPNAFIRDALKDEAITSLIDSYVYFAVGAEGYTIRAATKADVDNHFKELRPKQAQTLQRDLTVTTITSLANVNFADWTAFGVKAANVAELTKLSLPAGTTPVGYAVPFYFYDEFMKQATLGEATILGKKKAPVEEKITLSAETTLAEAVSAMLAHSYFQTDADIQEEMLDDLRKAIKNATTPGWIITALNTLHGNYPDGQSLRYRSSTNNEDLPSFNGAGLYDSKTQDPDETTDDGIDKSIKAVWASLWNYRAFLERDFHRVDHNTVSMGVLVHPNYSDELVNGVAVSYDPVTFQDNMHYVNSQVGEDLVTNPEAHSQPEELLLGANGAATVLSRSNLATSNQLLMSASQMSQLRSNLDTIHNRFRTLYGVQDGDDFAIEIEFKITAANHLAIKQARPWIFPEPLVLPNPEVSVVLSSAQVAEGELLDFTVTRSGGILSTPLTVDLAWSETQAMLNNNKPASVTLPANRTSVTVAAPIDNDQKDEHDSVVTVSIGANSEYTIGTSGSASATITDDDQTMIGVSGDTATVTEGSPADFTFTRSGSVLEQPLTVSVTVAESGSRLWGAAPTTVTFAANNASVAVSLPTTDDSVLTASSVVTIQIGSGSDYGIEGSGKAKVTIEDDDPPPTPEVSIAAGGGVTEGSAASFTLTATPNPAASLDVSVTVAQSGDYGATTGVRTVTVPTTGSVTFTVATSGDSVDEADGSVTATVGSGTGYTVSSSAGAATVAVSDDDDPPAVQDCVSDSLLATVRHYYDVNRNRSPNYGENWKRVLVAFGDVEDDLLLPYTAEEAQQSEQRWSGWKPIREALECIEAAREEPPPPPPPPEVSIAAGGGVTEGSAASFTLTATPNPAASLDVSVTVAQSGDYGATTGVRTVTVPTTGSVTFTVATSGDSVDEADGSVTATVGTGTGYTVSSSAGAATVTVSDDDVPEVSIAAGSGVTEGGDATFTVTAAPTPHAALTVEVTVSQAGDYGATTGVRTVTVPTTGSVTFTVATSGDSVDEADGSVTATVGSGTGYTVSSSAGAATVAVSDDDDPPAVQDCVSDSLLATVRHYYDVNRNRSPNYGENWKRVLVAFGDVEDDLLLPYTAEEAQQSEQRWSGWKPIREALECIEAAREEPPPPPPPPPTPEVSIAAGGGVTEGSAASFTLTATPNPAASLDVSVTVSQSGDYGATTGSRTVTVPTTGSVTFTVATSGDSVDEADGSVTATVGSGTGYTVSSSAGAATVTVSDDDDPPPPPPPPPPPTPEVSIAGGPAVTEGGDATFVVTADPTPAAPLTVSVTVSQSGDYGATTGARSVTIPTGGSYTLTVPTVGDGVDEADGSITATINSGSGYTVSATAAAATVAVSDDDDPLPVNLPTVWISDAQDYEDALLIEFRLELSEASSVPVTVTVEMEEGTATYGGDFLGIDATHTIAPGETRKTIYVSLRTDSWPEGDETFQIVLTSATGATIADGTAQGVILNDD